MGFVFCPYGRIIAQSIKMVYNDQMNINALEQEAKALTQSPKGILAIDENPKGCGSRFEKLGVENTDENRRAYREMLITAPGIEDYISGMIFFDETLYQKTSDGVLFTDIFKQKGMHIGIKVDIGRAPLALHPGELVVEGLDGLAKKLEEYKKVGATFAKYRSQLYIDTAKGFPSDACLYINSHSLARYAAICQDSGIVPIIEPEIHMEGSHNIDDSYNATTRTLQSLFSELPKHSVDPRGIILKIGMVISGKDCTTQANSKEIAEKTIDCFKKNVPNNIGGIVFLSGGQSAEQSTENLRAMHQLGDLPWPLSFSYGRGIQQPALEIWAKDPQNIKESQEKLLEMAKNNGNANLGK